MMRGRSRRRRLQGRRAGTAGARRCRPEAARTCAGRSGGCSAGCGRSGSSVPSRSCWRQSSVGFLRARARGSSATPTNVLFNGVVGKLLPAGVTKAQAIAQLRAHGQGQLADDGLRHERHARASGSTSTRSAAILGLAALVYLPRRGLHLGAGLHHGRRRPARDVRDAPRRRGEAGAAAAALLRQPPARRHPQPRHQRHRQPDAPRCSRDSASCSPRC